MIKFAVASIEHSMKHHAVADTPSHFAITNSYTRPVTSSTVLILSLLSTAMSRRCKYVLLRDATYTFIERH